MMTLLVQRNRFAFLVALMMGMAGCSTAPTQSSGPPIVDRGSQPPVSSGQPAPSQPQTPPVVTPLPPSSPSQPAPPARQQSSAVVALLDQANVARDQGNYRSAQGSLQRAQRIAPRDPDVYYALALTHLEMEDYGLAEQVALKGVSVAQGDNRQLKRLWNLVAQIRLRAGNVSGSQQAEERASRY